MKLTLKEKAKLFWERNKADIICWLAVIGVTSVTGAILANRAEAARKEHEEELARQQAELEEKRKAAIEAEAEREKRIANDPANQIAGGYVRPDEDCLEDPEYPNILVNTVPIANMGELGQEVLNRLNTEWFGEFGETGVENPFDPATATVDVIIDFGHEVWKRNHPEEAKEESQEKQAS